MSVYQSIARQFSKTWRRAAPKPNERCPQVFLDNKKIAICQWCGQQNSIDSIILDCYGKGYLISRHLCRHPEFKG